MLYLIRVRQNILRRVVSGELSQYQALMELHEYTRTPAEKAAQRRVNKFLRPKGA